MRLFVIAWMALICLPIWAKKNREVGNCQELYAALQEVEAGETILLRNGIYTDVKLIANAEGTAEKPIIIRAKNPGKAFFSGDAKVELRGAYTTLEGIYFKNGNRDKNLWDTHGPGLVAIYASHCRVSNCLFFQFDNANSAYITTSLDEQGNVPQYCRIDHCAFIQKTTFDQVINLNNTLKKTLEGESAPAMYHRIDHCYFANPKKKGNAGGGIRIGYWRKDLGRCLVDNNVFERQDSEAEIVTSKSRENVYYNNLFINCRGTLNFRHGDDQVALCNSFIATDQAFEYGGMFIWGSGHIVGKNYFNLPSTLKDRGNAAIYLNPGPKAVEHALAYNIAIIENDFVNTEGVDIHYAPLLDRRIQSFGKEKVEIPHDITLINNSCEHVDKSHICLFHPDFKASFTQKNIILKDKKKYKKHLPRTSIEKIDLDFDEILRNDQMGASITKEQVGPKWCGGKFPGKFAQTGKWKLIKRE